VGISAGENPSQQVAIWRPRAPPGYMILGDCATSGYEHNPNILLMVSVLSCTVSSSDGCPEVVLDNHQMQP
jgi:hypothetical protein